MMSLFLKHNLDMLVAAQTAPQNSYRNPVEHIMLVLNIELQSVGVMRKEMSEECETILKSCNSPSMEDIHKAASSITVDFRVLSQIPYRTQLLF